MAMIKHDAAAFAANLAMVGFGPTRCGHSLYRCGQSSAMVLNLFLSAELFGIIGTLPPHTFTHFSPPLLNTAFGTVLIVTRINAFDADATQHIAFREMAVPARFAGEEACESLSDSLMCGTNDEAI